MRHDSLEARTIIYISIQHTRHTGEESPKDSVPVQPWRTKTGSRHSLSLLLPNLGPLLMQSRGVNRRDQAH